MAYPSQLRMPESDLPDLLQRRYGIAAAVEQVRYGYRSTTVGLVSASGRMVLKVVHDGASKRQAIETALEMNRRLLSAGIPVARCIRSAEGAEEVSEAGNIIVLWRHVEGEPYRPGHLGQLTNAAALLGRIHAIGDARGGPCGSGLGAEAAAVLEDANRLREQAQRGVVRLPDGWCEFLQDAVERLGDRLGAAGLLPVSLTHQDFRAQNLLFSGDRVAAVLDTEDARAGVRLPDAAYSAVFFQAVVANGPLSGEEQSAFWRAYEPVARPSAAERSARPVCLLSAYLKGILLWLKIGCVNRSNEAALGWLASYRELGQRLVAFRE